MEIKPIARIYTSYSEKFGIPRQSGIASDTAVIIPEKEFCRKEAFRGLEQYSHLWLIWQFSESADKKWSPTVRPPRLGGNRRVGVFATRSPFRPNSLGLSSVRLVSVDLESDDSPRIYVEGADILNGTPIYDIKPYLAYTDSHPDAVCGFADEKLSYKLNVSLAENIDIPESVRNPLIQVLENDPRPAYQKDSNRVYKMCFMDYDVEFVVDKMELSVIKIENQGG